MHMKMGKDQSLDGAIKKWYFQQRSDGVNVCGIAKDSHQKMLKQFLFSTTPQRILMKSL